MQPLHGAMALWTWSETTCTSFCCDCRSEDGCRWKFLSWCKRHLQNKALSRNPSSLEGLGGTTTTFVSVGRAAELFPHFVGSLLWAKCLGPPRIRVWNPNPPVTLCGGGALGGDWVMRLEPSWMGLVPSWKIRQRALSPPLPREGTGRTQLPMNQEAGPRWTWDPPVSWSWDFPACGTIGLVPASSYKW